MNPRRWSCLVFGIPFILSLCLSACTVGDRVFWQDSGFYLVAVKEMSVLYPPGFALYQFLCKAWTILLFFIDFTLAVHLFSSLCAALAAGTLAQAARELLRSRGGLYRVSHEAEGPLADWASTAAGCLAATGYTFWFTAIYAKGYTLYYFLLAQLLWRMIRASETGKPREFTWVAALIGLAWAAHPSAALLGPALIAFVVMHWRMVGAKGIGLRAALSALCALGPSIAIPFLARSGSLNSLEDPSSAAEFLAFLRGTRFVALPRVFGWDASRGASFGQYLWEEFLGVGLAALAVGLVRTSVVNPRLMVWVGLWLVPYAGVTILFKMEGQHDCWFVASWMPLYLLTSLGVFELARKLRYSRSLVLLLTTASVGWAATANASLLNQRRYDLAETFGHLHLDHLDPDAILLVAGDDAVAICGYLQKIRTVRPDVVVVNAARLGEPRPWYLDRLVASYPFLRRPDLEGMRRRIRSKGGKEIDYIAAEFLNANLDSGHSVFTNLAPHSSILREEIALVPAGTLWKAMRRGEERVDPAHWRGMIAIEEVRRRYRRARAQEVDLSTEGVRVRPVPYEERLVRLLLGGRLILATSHLRQGNYAKAAAVYEDVRREDQEYRNDPQVLYPLALADYHLGASSRAQELFGEVLRQSKEPTPCAGSLLYLGIILKSQGNLEGAQRLWRTALAIEGADARLRGEILKVMELP